MRTFFIGLLALTVLAGAAQAQPSKGQHTLYFFFTPETPGQAELARSVVDYVLARKGAVLLRNVLLVEDFGALGRVKEQSPFTKALKELGRISGGPLDLAVYDEEGLAIAKSWKIRRLPTLVLVAEGKAHIATGSRSKPQDLEECRQ